MAGDIANVVAVLLLGFAVLYVLDKDQPTLLRAFKLLRLLRHRLTLLMRVRCFSRWFALGR